MEFAFSLEKILPDEVTIVNGDYLQSLKEKESITNLQLLIDRVGQSSARYVTLHVHSICILSFFPSLLYSVNY